MAFKKNNSSNKKSGSIVGKMVWITIIFTIIPLIVTATLIISTYQGLIDALLTEKGIELGREIVSGLFLTLDNSKIQASLIAFIAIVLTLFGNILMSRSLTKPLRKLLKGTHEIAKGNLDFKIDVGEKDEIGELSVRFNKMTEQLKEAKAMLERKVQARTSKLKKTTEALEEARATLEIKVQARTKELEELTKSLEGQVQQRTKELQGKVEQLEKFQKLSVGRELKMIELKKQIEELEVKLREHN